MLRLALLKVGLSWSESLEIGEEEALALIDDFVEMGKPKSATNGDTVRRVATRRLSQQAALAKKPSQNAKT